MEHAKVLYAQLKQVADYLIDSRLDIFTLNMIPRNPGASPSPICALAKAPSAVPT